MAVKLKEARQIDLMTEDTGISLYIDKKVKGKIFLINQREDSMRNKSADRLFWKVRR